MAMSILMACCGAASERLLRINFKCSDRLLFLLDQNFKLASRYHNTYNEIRWVDAKVSEKNAVLAKLRPLAFDCYGSISESRILLKQDFEKQKRWIPIDNYKVIDRSAISLYLAQEILEKEHGEEIKWKQLKLKL